MKAVSEKKFPYIFAESCIVLFYSASLNLLMPFVLGPSNFTGYALGLVTVAMYSFLSLGVPVLVPTIFRLNNNPEGVIIASMKAQVAILAIFIIVYLCSGINLLKIFLPGVERARLLMLSGCIMFAGQSIDDTMHVYLRMMGEQRRSLIINTIGKIATFGGFLLFLKFSRNGEYIFCTISVVTLMISVVKVFTHLPLRLIISNKGLSSSLNLLKINYFSLWVGGVSNTIYNGIMRLWLGKFIGIEILPLITISAQLSGAFASLSSALTFNLVNRRERPGGRIAPCAKQYKKAILMATFLFLICFIATIVVLLCLYRNNPLMLSGGVAPIAAYAVVALGHSANVLSTPRFQMSQLLGYVNNISVINMVLAVIGLATFWAMANYAQNNFLLLAVYASVSILSSLIIVMMSRSSRVSSLS